MAISTLQAKFIRSFWALLFAALAASSLVFLFVERSLGSARAVSAYIGLVVWTLLCRYGARFDRRVAITAAAVGTIPLAALVLNAPEVQRVLEVGALGRASFAAPSALLMGVLWGWPGALLTVVVGVLTLGAGGDALELLSAMTLLAFVGLSGASMGELIRRLEHANVRLGEVANRDAMTGLLNRRALETLPRVQGQWLLTTWDVDGLKRVNDSQGHAAGDAYLLTFVRALESATAASDRLFRTGGDEFVGLHQNYADAVALERRVRRSFAHVSMGWAVVRDGDWQGALLEADRMLYEAKAARYNETHAPTVTLAWREQHVA